MFSMQCRKSITVEDNIKRMNITNFITCDITCDIKVMANKF